MSEADLIRRIERLERLVEAVSAMGYGTYKGTKAADFTTTRLAHHGDYGYQTTDNEIQVNCDGTVRAITTAAL